jgi:hypothetical protein
VSSSNVGPAVPEYQHAGRLLSIHLTSNRPDNIVNFFDRLEAKTTDMSAVEVVLKIDDDDPEMNAILSREKAKRPFQITYISTPLEGGFFGLWRWYDELLKITDSDAYFVVGLNDEMSFAEKGWDQRLRKYVGLYPDHIYRLRTSIHRERSIYDYWEAGCANDLTPMMTKRWLDLSGGWCVCNGPDSFQNIVAFYFGWLYRHNTFGRPYRERVVHDIRLLGEGANHGMSEQALRRRLRGGVIAWFKLMSWPVQLEAARRAQRLHAHIWTAEAGIEDYEVRDNHHRRKVCVVNTADNSVLWRGGYKLSRLRIYMTNTMRKLEYPYYGGAGESMKGIGWSNLKYYWFIRHQRLDTMNLGRIAARDFVMGRSNIGWDKARERGRFFYPTYLLFRVLFKLFGTRTS